IQVPLQAPATQSLIERIRARKPTGETQSAHTPRTLPAVQIASVSVDVSDQHGALLRVEQGSMSSDAKGIGFNVGRVRVGGAPSAELALSKLRARVIRSEAGFALAGLTIGDARLWPAEPVAAQAEPEDADLDAAEDDGETDDALLAAGANKVANKDAATARVGAAPARPSLLKRMRAALAPAPAGTQVGAAASTATAAAKPEPKSLLDRLADGAEIKLETGAVYAARGAAAVLDTLQVQVKVRSDDALSFAGSGKAKGGGTMSWDLVVRPELVQADGSVKLRALPLDLVAPYLPAVPWYEPELGRIDAELVVKTEPAQGVAFSGEVGLRDAALSSARIAATPVHDIQVALHGRGRFLPLRDRLEIDGAELRVRGTELAVKGAVEWNRDHYLFDIDATMPPTPCTEAVRSIPEDLLGDMALASWRGKIGGKVHVKLDSRELDKGELELDPDDHCEFVAVPAMADLRRFQFPFTHSVAEPDGTEFEMETGPGTSEWTFIEDISPYFVHAVLAHEDGGFFNHHGFSEMHIRSALIRNLQEGRYVVGASTITMQLVKNVFLHREKTLARKIQEVLLTWWIERVMPKRDILELYLNVIEYGPGIYGIRRGARHYFNRLPGQLSPAEGVYLSTILPNPKRYHAYFERGALTPSWTEQIRRMLVRLRERGSYSPEAYEYGLSELQSFKFVPEGNVVAPRIVAGEAALLPYMQGYGEGAVPSWDDPAAAWDAVDGRPQAPGSTTSFTSGPAASPPPRVGAAPQPARPAAAPAVRPPVQPTARPAAPKPVAPRPAALPSPRSPAPAH
ncbi:MAG TPA: transglycosylase domain-containing protein, partial [Polyangiales bacterium]|nr:transglycosylase domain-containing protein [Polyangiales bacterium]